MQALRQLREPKRHAACLSAPVAVCSPSGRSFAPHQLTLRKAGIVAARASGADSPPGLAASSLKIIAQPPPGLSRRTSDLLPPLNEKATWLSSVEDGVLLLRQEFGLPGDLGPFVNGFAIKLRDGTYLVSKRGVLRGAADLWRMCTDRVVEPRASGMDCALAPECGQLPQRTVAHVCESIAPVRCKEVAAPRLKAPS